MRQAMIFAAGLGTRLRPLTDTMPKAMVPVGGRPLIDILLTKLYNAGFGRVVVNVHHFADMLEQHLNEVAPRFEGMDILVSDEREQLLDTGGGLRHAAPLFDASSPILIHNVDILSNASLNAVYADAPADGAKLLVSARPSSRMLVFNPSSFRLEGWINQNTGETKGYVNEDAVRLAFSGIHIFHPSLFPLMQSFPDKFSIIDFYLTICADNEILGFNDINLHLLDVGKVDSLSAAEAFLHKAQ